MIDDGGYTHKIVDAEHTRKIVDADDASRIVDADEIYARSSMRTMQAGSTIYGCRWDTREVKVVAVCASCLIHCVSTDTPLDADSP